MIKFNAVLDLIFKTVFKFFSSTCIGKTDAVTTAAKTE